MAYTMRLDLGDMTQVYNVSFPVGPKMPNVRDDVMLVQTLMKMANYDRLSPHGPVERSANITVDGYFGPQTQRMIKAFEIYWRSMRKLIIADGIVEPAPKDGYTRSGMLYKILHLNRAAFVAAKWKHESLPFNDDTHPILRGTLQKGAVKPAPTPRPF